MVSIDKAYHWMDRRANDNSRFKKLAFQWLIEHLRFVSSAVVADSFSTRNRQLLKPENVFLYQRILILNFIHFKFS
jgi:hypothetical protein